MFALFRSPKGSHCTTFVIDSLLSLDLTDIRPFFYPSFYPNGTEYARLRAAIERTPYIRRTIRRRLWRTPS